MTNGEWKQKEKIIKVWDAQKARLKEKIRALESDLASVEKELQKERAVIGDIIDVLYKGDMIHQ